MGFDFVSVADIVCWSAVEVLEAMQYMLQRFHCANPLHTSERVCHCVNGGEKPRIVHTMPGGASEGKLAL